MMRGGQPPLRGGEGMEGNGWIKLHRQVTEWEWYQDGNTFRLFVHLLIKANHEPKKWQGIDIDRGQCVTSIGNLAEELHLSVKQIRTAIKHLEKSGNVAHRGARKYSVFVIHNYRIYQAREEEAEDAAENKGQGEGQAKGKQRATNKNVRM